MRVKTSFTKRVGRRLHQAVASFAFASLVFAAGVSAAPDKAAMLRGHVPSADRSPQAASDGFATRSGAGSRQTFGPGQGGLRKNPDIQIDPELPRVLASGGTHNFVIELSARPDLSAASSMDWQTRGRWVYRQLKNTAERSQARLVEFLRERDQRFETYVAKNAILVRDGDLATLQRIATFEGIKRVRIPPQYGPIRPVDPGNERGKAQPKRAKVLGTNIGWVEADRVWNELTDASNAAITGVGAVVGVIDSGVRYDHEALITQYRGNTGGTFDHNFNWFDPEGNTLFPAPLSNDINDQHGTHVAGTIVGDDFAAAEVDRDRVGMAPGAKWIACQGFAGDVDAALLGCGDFMLAPTDLNGANANPNLRPHAVNNSWGACSAGEADDFYEDVIEAWLAAGVMPVFAAGNASNCSLPNFPGLGTVSSPGADPRVFTIGSTGNSDGNLAGHSLWGPTRLASIVDPNNPGLPDLWDNGGGLYPRLKPNVVAPGVNVRSTIGTGTNTYDQAGWSGTSMSTPHVVGLIALMVQACPTLAGDFATLGTLIQQNARPINYNSGTTEGATAPGPNNHPNYATGWGEIDAYDTVQAAIDACGPQTFIEGTVTATTGGAAIAGATVEIDATVDGTARTFTAVTDATGSYERQLPLPDTSAADVSVTAYGYIGESQSGVVLTDGGTAQVDFVLDTAAFYQVSGIVTDAATGWPLHARIDISGFPGSPIYADPVTGEYLVSLADGMAYGFSVSPSVAGYNLGSATVGPLIANAIQDFGLNANVSACTAPGYSPADALVLSENFEADPGNPTTPPTGWTSSTQGTLATPGWRFGTALGSSFFPVPAHTRYAAANDDDQDDEGSFDYLVTPAFSLATASAARLVYASHIRNNTGHAGSVAYSISGGPWTTFHSPTKNSAQWLTQTVNLPAAVLGQASVQLRFHSDDLNGWGYGWAIDDVQVTEPGCVAPATGGLIVGRVSDENTGAFLNGAQVSVGGGASVTTANIGGIGDGAYTVFSVPGSASVTASPTAALPAGYGSDAATVPVVDAQVTAQDLALPAPRIQASPAPSATLNLGQVQPVPFAIQNTGGMPLGNYVVAGTQLMQDFEAGVPPTGWSVTDEADTGCVWDTNVAWGQPNFAGGAGISAHAETDGCGLFATADTSLISPPINLAFATQASLDFVLSHRIFSAGGSELDVDASIDNGASWTTLEVYDANVSPTGPGAAQSIDLGDYLGQSAVRLRFRYVSGWEYWAAVDQIRVYTDANSTPWLGLAPDEGTLGAAPASQPHNAIFRANQVEQPGVYQSQFRVLSATPTPYGVPAVNATMTVTAPASFGTLSGTVRGLGYCDENPAPLAGATVFIQGRTAVYQTTTAANGGYAWQLDAGQGPVQVTVRAPGHLDAVAQGVALTAGTTASASLDLRAERPCFKVLENGVSSTLQVGGSGPGNLTLANDGAAIVDPFLIEAGGSSSATVDRLLSQNVDHDTILSPNSVACPTGPNGFYRLYVPANDGYTGDVTIESLRLGVETTEGGREVEVGFYAVEGPIETPDAVTQVGDFQTVALPDGDGYIQDITLATPIVVPAETQLLVEVWSVDDLVSGDQFYPGSNDAGESAPSYILADACGASWLTPFEDLGFPEVQLIIDVGVSGSGPVCGAGVTPITWLGATPDTGTVAADSTMPIGLTFTAGANPVGTYPGALCVSAADPDNGLVAVPATMTVVADVPDTDLSVAVVASTPTAQVGTPVDFDVTVTNAGPDASNGVSVSTTLPAGLSYEGYEPTGGDWSCVEGGGAVTCTYGAAIAVSGTATVTVRTSVLSAGTWQPTFTVATTQEDPVSGNNTGSASVNGVPAPDVDLAVNASLEPASVITGSQTAVKVVVANLGDDAANDVEVVIALPAGIAFVSGAGTGWSCAVAGSDVVCERATALDNSLAPELRVTLSTAGAAPASYPIEVDVGSAGTDINAANNSSSLNLTVIADPNPPGPVIFGNGFEGNG